MSLLVERRYGALPVVDEAGIVRGILSTVDVLRAVEELRRWRDVSRARTGRREID